MTIIRSSSYLASYTTVFLLRQHRLLQVAWTRGSCRLHPAACMAFQSSKTFARVADQLTRGESRRLSTNSNSFCRWRGRVAAVLFQGASRGLREFSHTSKGLGHQLTHNSQDLVRVRLAVSRSESKGPASVAKRRAWR